jgi:orotate phosphoribosyltransferase
MELREDIAIRLLQINAIILSLQNPFTWASGILSPIYCDNRLILSYPEQRKFIISAFAQLANQFQPFDAISGVATAGIAHGALLAQEMDLPFSYVRSKSKGHGRQNKIEGKVQSGQRILVIEDLISTGGSAIAAIEALRQTGCNVVGVMAIFQYNFKQAQKRFEEANSNFATLSDYKSLVSAARSQEMFTESEFALLEAWHTNPQEWKPALKV